MLQILIDVVNFSTCDIFPNLGDTRMSTLTTLCITGKLENILLCVGVMVILRSRPIPSLVSTPQYPILNYLSVVPWKTAYNE